jgi:hypothetical protein
MGFVRERFGGVFVHGEKWKQCSQHSNSHNRWKERYNQMWSFLIGSMLEQLIPKQTLNFYSSCIVKDQANGVRSGKVWWGQCV